MRSLWGAERRLSSSVKTGHLHLGNHFESSGGASYDINNTIKLVKDAIKRCSEKI